MGLFGLFRESERNDRPFRTNWAPGKAPERSCLDCRYCNLRRAKNYEIYCNWDDVYYYPETGISCDDFCRR